MRRLAKIFKTLTGAQKRAAFERMHGKPKAHVVRCDGGWQIEY